MKLNRDLRSFEIRFEFESDVQFELYFESDVPSNRPHIIVIVRYQQVIDT